MKAIRFSITLIFITIQIAFSQPDTTKAPSNWTPEGVTGINISQVSLTNWTQGGESSFTWTLFGNFGLTYADSSWKIANKLKIAYGMTKLGSKDFRNNDNELYFETVVAYKINWAVDPFFSNTIRTVIANAFDYTKTPEERISSFFDPGYITQSLGFTFDKLKGFTTRLGIGLQETFTNTFRQYSDDKKTNDKVEAFKLETGIESVTEGSYTLAENLLHTSKLRLFGRLNELDYWDVRWDNTSTAKINSFLNVNLNILMIYERAQSPKTQLKEALQIGLTYNVF